MTDEIRSDLVIEVFRPPFWDQILFELPCILVSPIQTPGGGGEVFGRDIAHFANFIAGRRVWIVYCRKHCGYVG